MDDASDPVSHTIAHPDPDDLPCRYRCGRCGIFTVSSSGIETATAAAAANADALDEGPAYRPPRREAAIFVLERGRGKNKEESKIVNVP